MSASDGSDGRRPGDTCPDQLLELVAGSPLRWRVLEVLADAPADVQTLVQRLDAPRTTARHNLGKLAERGLIEEARHQHYRITTIGRAVVRGLEVYQEYVEVIDELEPFFECVPPTALECDVRYLAGAELTVSDRTRPYAPATRLIERLADADLVVGKLATMPPIDDPQLRDVLEYTETQFVISPSVAEILAAEFGPAVENAVSHDLFDVRVSEVSVPYGVVVVDDTVGLWATDENGKPHAFVETDDATCRAWAVERIESRLAEATPVGEYLGRD